MSVRYHVTVYTGDLPLAGTTDKISLSLVGSLRSSKTFRFCCLTLFKRGGSKSMEVKTQSDLGDILLVKLFKKKRFLLEDSWYCSHITVKTLNNIYYFPCYTWLIGGDSLDVIEGTAWKQHESGSAILEEYRKKEMQKRQDMYQWRTFAPGIPKSINCEKSSDLPRDAVMPFGRKVRTFYNIDAAIVELGLQPLKMCHEVWSMLSELQTLCEINRDPVSEYVKKHWKEDRFFGYQYLNGLNPVLIQQCSEIPAKFPVTDEMVAPTLAKGTTLQQEVQNGNIFIVDHVLLNGIAANTKPKQQYLEALMCLLYLNPRKELVPIAIQLKQEPGPENPIFLPTDSKYDWLLAKVWVRHADTQVHQLISHLLNTHLFAEVFCIATLRKLPSAHPIFKLLMPHLKFTLHINTEARGLLISEGGVFDQAFSTGEMAKLRILQHALANTTYSSLCLPDNVASRRVDKIPNYYYRDDALKIWHAINKFVANIIDIYYKSDASVQEDEEIHEWAKEIFTEGFLAKQSSGFPTSFSTKGDLVKYLTMVIFTCSAQHSAVNAGQFDWGSWVPNSPSTMQKPAPTEKGKVTEEDILNTLPMKSASVLVLATIHLLSQPSPSEVSSITPKDHKTPRRQL
ncbi:polyunsaturated fatty acid 5-lipoxygenase-like isoform X1 [Hemitrygon akajei]|uniref:polyunsaturated fatty acid 5-lipoxygenase-like isoform X1 n=1 Tax=Hemitrygon akajei TaxID=2704970 RepID=UPI003BF998DD